MAEFLGGTDLDHGTAIYVSAVGPRPDEVGAPVVPRQAARWLELGWDVARSLWDRSALLADLDLEHVHFENPFAAFLWPERPFRVQAPLVASLEAVLKESGIVPLHVLSGRGHHFVWSVPRDSTVFRSLSELGSQAVADDSSTPFAPWAGRPDPEREAAFLALGMVMEEAVGRPPRPRARRRAVGPPGGSAQRGSFRGAVVMEIAGTDDPEAALACAREGRLFLRETFRRKDRTRLQRAEA